jgi:hypothetical protein
MVLPALVQRVPSCVKGGKGCLQFERLVAEEAGNVKVLRLHNGFDDWDEGGRVNEPRWDRVCET